MLHFIIYDISRDNAYDMISTRFKDKLAKKF